MFHVKHLEDVNVRNVSRETFPDPYFLWGSAKNYYPGEENRGVKMGPLAEVSGPSGGVKNRWFRHDQASSVF
jgi:hypothetical protein